MAWQMIVQAVKDGIQDAANVMGGGIDKWANSQIKKPAAIADAKKDEKAADQNLANTGSQLVADALNKSSNTGASGLGFDGTGKNGVGGGAGMKEGQDFLGSLSDENQKENVRGSVLKSWLGSK
jgi:hypothetical protein